MSSGIRAFQSGCGTCNPSTDYLKNSQTGGDLSQRNYGILTNTSNGGKPRKKSKPRKTSKPRKKSKPRKTSKPRKKGSVIKKKSLQVLRKIKRMFKIKGGATGLPSRWYNNNSVSKTPEHSSNALSTSYGKYEPRSMGTETNLYPYSPFSSADPFTMIQDNKVGGAKKRVKRKVKKSVKKSIKKSVKKSIKKSVKRKVKKSIKKSVKRKVKKSVKRKPLPKKKASLKK